MTGSIRDVLERKGNPAKVHSTPHDTFVLAAVGMMNAQRIGSLLITDRTTVVGILTERDVLLRVVEKALDPARTRVGQVMTRELVTIESATPIVDALRLINERRCRHLPVFDGGRLCGMVSAGDLTSWLVRDHQLRIRELEDYITH